MTNERRAALHRLRADWRIIKRQVETLKTLYGDDWFDQEEVVKGLLREFTSYWGHTSEVMLIDLPYDYFKIYLSWASSYRFKEPWQVLNELTMQLDAKRGEI